MNIWVNLTAAEVDQNLYEIEQRLGFHDEDRAVVILLAGFVWFVVSGVSCT